MRLPFPSVMSWTIFAMVMLIPAMGAADFYKYKDSKGVVRFTDNILEVPEDQRDQAAKYKSIKTAPVPQKAAKTGSAGKEPGKMEGASEPVRPGQEDTYRAEKERLDALKAELTQEYSDLIKLRGELEEAREMAVDAKAKRAVENRIIELNARIRDFDEKSKAFEKELNAYNTRVRSGG